MNQLKNIALAHQDVEDFLAPSHVYCRWWT